MPSPEMKLDPRLILVSGPPASGKTTLAHRLAESIGCPAICRDEIKEGMVHAFGDGFEPATADPLTARTYPLFFDCLRLLLSNGVTVVAEAAFQHKLWARGLEPLQDLAEMRIVRCSSGEQALRDRRRSRVEATGQNPRSAHLDAEVPRSLPDWDPIHLDHPTLDVDTTDGYQPGLDAIVGFCGSG